MTLKDKNTKDSDTMEEVEEIEEGEDIVETGEEEAESIAIDEIPIEEFMKDPEKMAKYTDETDVEETTKYCPQCSDYTIFVNNICSNCGFAKTVKKSDSSDEDDEDKIDFDLIADDNIVDDLGYEYSEDEESYD
jgi:ribosomal protein S27AE